VSQRRRDEVDILFGNFDGRISRKTFWLARIDVTAVELVGLLIAAALVEEDWLLDIVYAVFLYPQFVIDVKRGHDRNIPLWIIGACYAVLAARDGLDLVGWLQTKVNQNVFSSSGIVSFVATIIAGIVALALMVELGFRKGTPGPNLYGPDPLAKGDAALTRHAGD
jgi:uncharacterized membrane protein YhaH (DUF805 family)